MPVVKIPKAAPTRRKPKPPVTPALSKVVITGSRTATESVTVEIEASALEAMIRAKVPDIPEHACFDFTSDGACISWDTEGSKPINIAVEM